MPPPQVHRGSQKHVLVWTGQPSFLDEFAEMLAPCPVHFSAETRFMPRGVANRTEARLATFGPSWLPGDQAWPELKEWWLGHGRGGNTPNWDIAVACEIEGSPGLVLVEAKANWPELGTGRKRLAADASASSRENHERIGAAIAEACAGWKLVDDGVCISRDSHYQLANRLAFTWKLATLGIPVVLLYLGFTGDEGIRDAGRPFADDADWQKAFNAYVSDAVPLSMFERRLEVGLTPIWLVVRSRPVIEASPPRAA